MSIANELSSDVATAVLALRKEQAPSETERLIEIIRKFHSVLRPLSEMERSKHVGRESSGAPSSAVSNTATGSY